MRVRFLLTLGRRSVEEFLEDNCTQMAAAISYYVLFSIFPLLIFVVGVLGFVLQDSQMEQDVIDAVLEFVPLSEDEGRREVTDAVRAISGAGSGALGLIGLLGMAWSGSAMFAVIRRSLNAAYDLDIRRPVVQQKLIDLAMVAGLGAFFLSSIGATAFLVVVRERSEDIPHLGDFAEEVGFAWDAASYLVPLVFSFFAFAGLYWFVPATAVRLRDVWAGALVAAVAFEVAKVGFTVYLENFSNYDLVYGSLGAVVAFLFWVYLSSNIMLFGAEVAAEYPRVRRGDYDAAEAKPAKPLEQRVREIVRGLFIDSRPDEKRPESNGERRPE
jgi:membrane protein